MTNGNERSTEVINATSVNENANSNDNANSMTNGNIRSTEVVSAAAVGTLGDPNIENEWEKKIFWMRK